jgi:hypothetical protein
MSAEIFHCEQNSPEWHICRLGIPTASEFKSILAKGEGKMRKTYLYKLLGERFTGEQAESFTNSHMERGHAMEDEARRLYAFQKDMDPEQIGFIRNGDVGCSPDSVVSKNGLVEIKTKLPHLQLEAFFADKLPSEHQAQVQGQLWVAEREWCDFVSYWPRLPLFVKRIHRDDAYINELRKEVERFLDDLNILTEKLVSRGAIPAQIVLPAPEHNPLVAV